MTPLGEFVRLCRDLEAARGRLDKRRRVAAFLRRVDAGEVATVVAFLTGRPFPSGDPRVLGVRGLPRVSGEGTPPPLTIGDVAAIFGEVAAASGPGARRVREQRLEALAARASAEEREVLGRIIGAEMRTGVFDGVALEAIAELAGADADVTRRAALFLGDLSAVAVIARADAAAGLAGVGPRLFVPMLPMLAEIAMDFDEVLAAHGGRTALDYKYDGARVQLHSDGERVGIWTRRLSDVTRSLPEIAALARRDLRGAPLILDGEVVALDRAGRPLPFQELMRRFRRIHRVESLAAELPLALHLFDCLREGPGAGPCGSGRRSGNGGFRDRCVSRRDRGCPPGSCGSRWSRADRPRAARRRTRARRSAVPSVRGRRAPPARPARARSDRGPRSGPGAAPVTGAPPAWAS
jgi:DNA ligase-1